jgi:hypothetical protein
VTEVKSLSAVERFADRNTKHDAMSEKCRAAQHTQNGNDSNNQARASLLRQKHLRP